MGLAEGIRYSFIGLIVGVLLGALWYVISGNLIPAIATTFAIPQTSVNGMIWAHDQMAVLNTGEWIVVGGLVLAPIAISFLYGFIILNDEDTIAYER